MVKHKRKGELDFVFDNAMLNMGVVGATGVVGKLSDTMPSSSSSSIMKGMETLSIVPTLHATGGIFGQLRGLERKTKRKR